MPEPGQDAKAKIQELQQRLKQMEAAAVPDLAAIKAVHAELDALRKRDGGKPMAGADKPQMDDFHSWASDSSKRYVDPSIYGEGPQFANPSDAEAVASAPPLKKEAPKPAAREWNDDLDRIKKFLIADVIKKAYESATLGGKKSLGTLAKEMMQTGKPNAFSKFQVAVRKGIEAKVKSVDLGPDRWEEVIMHLVVDLSTDFYDIEHRDGGATRLVQSFVAREFLTQESYRELDKKGVFDK